MKKKSFMMLVISAYLLLAMSLVSLAGCSSGGSTDGGDSSGTGDATSQSAQQLYEDKCSECHSLSTAESADATTYDEWLSIVKSMQAKTTTISDADAEEIANYLANR